MGKKKLTLGNLADTPVNHIHEPTVQDLDKTVEQNLLERANALEKEAAELRTAIFALPESVRTLTRQQARKIGYWF